VAIEEAVFLLSLFGEGRGCGTVSLEVVLRESQEKGLVNFLGGAGGAAECDAEAGGCGGGDHGTDGSLPERPWKEDFLGWRVGFVSSSATPNFN
jgi:hypothetical protein